MTCGAAQADENTIVRETRDEVWIDGPDAIQPGADRSFPDVAVDSKGQSIHVWQAFGDLLGDRGDIFLRRFAADDTPLGSPQLVNSLTEDDQQDPRIAVRTDGAFFVVWQSDEYDPEANADRRAVRGQFFDSTGTPQGSEQPINQISTDFTTEVSAKVAALDNGTFVVVWDSRKGFGTDSVPCTGPNVPSGCESVSVQARRIASNGAPTGDQFQVNVDPDRWQYEAAVVATSDGGFFVAWTSDNSIGTDGSSRSVQGRRFNASGTALTGEFQINTTTASAQDAPEMARSGEGQVLVVFESPNLINTRNNVRGRLYDESGNAVGDDFYLSTFEGVGHQYTPRVAGGSHYFLTAWSTGDSIGTDTGGAVNARIVVGRDEFDGGQFQVNVFESGDQGRASVGANQEHAVVSFRAGQHPLESNDDAIYARGYEFCLFCDDFECGDSRRWSSAVGN